MKKGGQEKIPQSTHQQQFSFWVQEKHWFKMAIIQGIFGPLMLGTMLLAVVCSELQVDIWHYWGMVDLSVGESWLNVSDDI